MTQVNPKGSGPFYCRACNRRFDVGGPCNGCGGLRAKWYDPPKPAVKCPACGCGVSRDIDGARECSLCHAQFEPVEFSFCDDRPDINAEKAEREAAHAKNNRMKHRVGRREKR